jgi:hypothetical protein
MLGTVQSVCSNIAFKKKYLDPQNSNFTGLYGFET